MQLVSCENRGDADTQSAWSVAAHRLARRPTAKDSLFASSHSLHQRDMVYLVGGGYEGQIIGFELPASALQQPASSSKKHRLLEAPPPIFAFSAHAGCIRSIACSSALLATGATDNTLGCYNLRKRRSYGKLLQQDGGGAVSCLRFFGESHLISAGEDGELCIWRTSDWECLLRMKGHKGAVHDVAIHPSGRLAISVAADRKLMLWNLTTGKCSYTSSLAQPSHMLRWTPAADGYVVGAPGALLVHELRSGVQLHSLPHGAAPLAMEFGTARLLVSGGEEKSLRCWDVATGECELTLPGAHAARVKAIAKVADNVLASGSTDGAVKLWLVADPATGKAKLQPLMQLETRMRLTTLGASTQPVRPTAATKGEEGEDEDEEDGEDEDEDVEADGEEEYADESEDGEEEGEEDQGEEEGEEEGEDEDEDEEGEEEDDDEDGEEEDDDEDEEDEEDEDEPAAVAAAAAVVRKGVGKAAVAAARTAKPAQRRAVAPANGKAGGSESNGKSRVPVPARKSEPDMGAVPTKGVLKRASAYAGAAAPPPKAAKGAKESPPSGKKKKKQ